MLSTVSIKNLLEAGVHFGHQTRKWDPRMAPYIYTKRNEIHILDLQKTVKLILKACDRIKKVAEQGGNILFVSTKRQAQEIVREAAERAGVHYVNHRWLGGTLTNFNTIRQRINHLKKLERMIEVGDMELLGKKERARRMRELKNLSRNLNGIREMDGTPDIVFLVDPSREHLAVDECVKLKIPIVAITDSNCDPSPIQFVIPGNDDAIRSIKLIVNYLTDAIVEGKELSRATQEKEEVAVS
jgi:small subunit ribosomal protein S2